MITKITIVGLPSRAYYPQKERKPYGERSFKDAYREMNEMYSFFHSVAQFVSHVTNYPGCDVRSTMMVYFGKVAEVVNVTKSKRTYFLSGIYVHEEDVTPEIS